jgi:alpha-glucosidase
MRMRRLWIMMFSGACLAAGNAWAGVYTAGGGIPGSTGDVDVKSPHDAVSVAVGVTADGRLSYVAHADGREVVGVSPLGLTVDGQDLGQGAKIIGPPVAREIHETYPIYGVHSVAHNDCREASIPLACGAIQYHVVVRAYDDGIALRYELDGKAGKINSEDTGWNLPHDGRYTWAAYDDSYENIVHTATWDKLPAKGVLSPPLTAEVAGHFVAISEANNQSFADMGLLRDGDEYRAVFPASSKGWAVHEDHLVSPWRVTIITRDLTALVNSDLLTNLCPAPDPAMDFSWVTPGRCLWQWCSVGAPKLNDQHDWYDAAVKLKWEYYLIDDGWRKWKQDGKDQWTLLKDVIAYGTSKGIKTLVWVNSAEMRDPKASRAYLERVKACGAVGIKIDFFPPATPEVIRWQLELLKETAELHLLCNFHGAVKPTGLRRTWPHELTREAVRGDEYQMTRYKRLRPMEMDCNQPFNRYLLGPADITPVVLDPKELRGYTWPHMMAQALVTYSPVTHFYDQYKFYVGSPAEDLFQDMPVVWDETRVLPGTVIGEVAGFARRKGDTWWIGIVNGAADHDLRIPLDFLKKSTDVTLLFDQPSKDDALDRQDKTLGPADTLSLKLRPGGGFVARLGPAGGH